MRISFDEELRGRTVIDVEGRVVGVVDGVLLDSKSWRVEAFHVAVRKEAAAAIGDGAGSFHPNSIELPIALVHTAGDAVILNIPVRALTALEPAARTAP